MKHCVQFVFVTSEGENIFSEYIELEYIPKIGESINCRFFELQRDLDVTNFKINNIIHHYVDDFSSLDYIEILLCKNI